jgi:CRISPR-associated protein Cmr6
MGRVLTAEGQAVLRSSSRDGLGVGANPRVLLSRTAFEGSDRDRRNGTKAVLRWAADHNLGQERELVASVNMRRTAALNALVQRGYVVKRLLVRPLWHLAVGLGDHANAHEVGLSLHGTYGWPVIPASSLKGMVCAFASERDGSADLESIFGRPRPSVTAEDSAQRARGDASMGSMVLFDGIPAEVAVIERDVLTPHVQPYYAAVAASDTADGSERGTVEIPAPAEYHNPVPFEFLVVADGGFRIDLASRNESHASKVAEWVRDALDEMGVGAKTSAGYGYMSDAGTDAE